MKALFCGCDPGNADNVAMALRIRWPEAEVRKIDTGLQRLESAYEWMPDVIFLDVTSTKADNFKLLREARTSFSGPIIALARRPSDMEMLEALDAGADDYLGADASAAELAARVNAVLRRASAPDSRSEVIARCGNLSVDPEMHEARIDGQEVYLTPTEFKLIYHLARNRGRLVTQEALHELIWGFEGKLYIQSLRKYIERLRKKLREAPRSDIHIVSVPRMGYKLLIPRT